MRDSKHEDTQIHIRRGTLVAGRLAADLLDQSADDVADGDVSFLNALGILGGNIDEEIHAGGEFASALAGHPDYERPTGTAGFGAANYIGALAAGGNRDNDVAGVDERLDLARIDSFEAEIIRGSGEDGSIRGEGNRWKTDAIPMEANDKFGGEVLCVGGAAAIAEEYHFVFLPDRGSSRLGEAGDSREQFI